MIKRLFFRLTGGRPMTRTGTGFVDTVSGQNVDMYVDGRGRYWLANGRWSWFRVKPILNYPITSFNGHGSE